MSGTTELIMAYGIMSAIIVFYVNHLRSRIVFCPLKSVNFPPPSKRNRVQNKNSCHWQPF